MKARCAWSLLAVAVAPAMALTGCKAVESTVGDPMFLVIAVIVGLVAVLFVVWRLLFAADEPPVVENRLETIRYSLEQMTRQVQSLRSDLGTLSDKVEGLERRPPRVERTVEVAVPSAQPVRGAEQASALQRRLTDLERDVADSRVAQTKKNGQLVSAITSLGEEIGVVNEHLSNLARTCERLKSEVSLSTGRIQLANGSLQKVLHALAAGAVSGSDQARAFEEVTGQVVERVAAERDNARLHQQAVQAQAVKALILQLAEAAPESLRSELERTFERIVTLADGYGALSEGARSGGLPVHLSAVVRPNGSIVSAAMQQLGQQSSQLLAVVENPAAAWQELVETLIPSVIDLCDDSVHARSRSADDRDGRAVDFYRRLPTLVGELAAAAGLELISPPRGTRFDPAVHAAVKLQRTDDASLRETVAVCTSRGYRLDGQLLRKASVTLYR